MDAPSVIRRRQGALLAIGLAPFVALGAGQCARPSAPAAKWPPGTVLTLNGVPLTEAEIDQIGSGFALLEPQDSILQLRRLALSTVIFPGIAARDIDPNRREEALRMARAWKHDLESGTLPSGPLSGPMEVETRGTFPDLGFEVWRAALDAEPGRWSEVIESPGAFHLMRVKKREEGALPALVRFTIGAFHFPYLDPPTGRAAIEAALDRSHLTLLDESWREAVPPAWLYRLHANP